jgi:MFS family permease
MMHVNNLFRDPWRAVPVFGVTQVLAWGAIYYTPVLMVPQICAANGWSTAFAMSGFSLGILVSGFLSPHVGMMIDRFGGHAVMPFGSLIGAVGLCALPFASHPAAYLATWAWLGLAMASSFYDPAFASLGRIFGNKARGPITMLTLIAGFASTVSWPATQFLIETIGWRSTYVSYGIALAIVAAPLHAFALPRSRAHPEIVATDAAPPAPAPIPRGRNFILLGAAVALISFVPSALLSNLLAMFQRLGLEPSVAVAIGALFGPCQVGARVCEFMFARNTHPLLIVRAAVGFVVFGFVLLFALGLSASTAALFMILMGLGNGLVTICRGTVPLAIYGSNGYGRLIGRIARPGLMLQSAAPPTVAFVAEHTSDMAALKLVAVVAACALACFLAVRRAPTRLA